MNKSVYLLYEGDEWLSRSSRVLMGVFDSEEDLWNGAYDLIYERIDEHVDYAEGNIFELEEGEHVDEQEVMADLMNELKENWQTQGWVTNYVIKEVELNKLEEAY